MMSRSVVLALVSTLALVTAATADDSKPPPGLRIFYTGHSFHMFVPPRVEQLVKSAGIEGHKLVGTQGIGGSRVIQHWDLADEKNKAKPALASGEVDVFTMAAHLQIPDEGIAKFTELGLAHIPNLRLLVQASWYPFDLPGEKRIRNNADRDNANVADLQAAIDEWRKRLEAQVDELNKQHGKTPGNCETIRTIHRPDRPRRAAHSGPGVLLQFRRHLSHEPCGIENGSAG
jgi:hypothetical protein